MLEYAMIDRFIRRNSVFAWNALATGLILLIPFAAMRFTTAVDWDAPDFIVMAVLLFGAGSAFFRVARKAPRRYRAAVGVAVALAFLYVWAELAVGVFTTLGS